MVDSRQTATIHVGSIAKHHMPRMNYNFPLKSVTGGISNT